VWWLIPVISALRRLRQKDLKFKAGLEYTGESCFKQIQRTGRGGGGATKLVKYFDTVISFLELYFFKGTPKVGGGRNNWKKKDSHSHDK
jgi:hypothetical protein